VDRDIAWPSEKSASVTCVHVIGIGSTLDKGPARKIESRHGAPAQLPCTRTNVAIASSPHNAACRRLVFSVRRDSTMIAALACWSKIGLDRESEVALPRA
jgi:hypothetical protein